MTEAELHDLRKQLTKCDRERDDARRLARKYRRAWCNALRQVAELQQEVDALRRQRDELATDDSGLIGGGGMLADVDPAVYQLEYFLQAGQESVEGMEL